MLDPVRHRVRGERLVTVCERLEDALFPAHDTTDENVLTPTFYT